MEFFYLTKNIIFILINFFINFNSFYINYVKFSHKYGIMHLTSSSTASFSQPINNNFFGEIFLTNICFDFSKNNEDKNYSVYILLATIKSYFNFKSSISKKNMQYFNNTVSKILKCKYIYLQKKIELINYFFTFSKSIIK